MSKLKYKYLICIVFMAVALFLCVYALGCGLSDKDAILLSKNFCKKMGVYISTEPMVLGSRYDHFNLSSKSKELVVRPRGTIEASFDISCKDKEITRFDNHKLRDQVFREYNISLDNRKKRNWPKLLPENKAKEIVFIHANNINLPEDVIFSHMSLDKTYNGAWIGHWKRVHNGYLYENDSLSVAIMAINGEFYSYAKHFLGKPCSTDVKIPKDRAIEVSRGKVSDLLRGDMAKKHLQDFVVTSSELKIIQPNTIFGFLTPFHSTDSRLAWVVTYSLPSNDLKLAEEVNFSDKFVIKVDAATGKVIGGDFSR